MNEFLDIPYTSASASEEPVVGPHHPSLHSFDLYVPQQTSSSTPPTPPPPPPPLICFIHGGAWRSEDKREHSALARSLAEYTNSPVVVPNYCLTKTDNKLQHPAHAQDILQFLTFLISWSGPRGHPGQPYDPNRFFLIGHSCGAHMLACILLDSSDPALVPPDTLLRAVRGVIFSEGIYDIDSLLQSFPAYRDWFIRDAFGSLPTYDLYSATKMTLREGATHISWAIVHSDGDNLVDTVQSQAMYNHLQSLHRGGFQEAGHVLKNCDDLHEGHNAVLQSRKYVQIVGDLIQVVSSA